MEKATPGPWDASVVREAIWRGIRYAAYDEEMWENQDHLAGNAAFIAASREDIPWLLAQVERTCAWTWDTDGFWHTRCGGTWCFENAGPEENGVGYCFRCGGAVTVPASDTAVPAAEEETE